MSLPSEDQSQGHNLDEIRGFLDARHPEQYLVFNLSNQHYDTSKLNNQVSSNEVELYNNSNTVNDKVK